MSAAAELIDVVSIFTSSRQPTIALQRASLTVEQGETLAITGPSGSGKSTLLSLLLGTLSPTAGEVRVLGGPPRDLGRRRVTSVGAMLQLPSHNLLLSATVTQNVDIVRRSAGLDRNRSGTTELLESLRLGQLADRGAASLSGGEQQRLALAIALCTEPELLLIDEPTSQQDAASAAQVIDVLCRASYEDGATVIAVTHDELLAQALNRSITIRDGILGTESTAGREVILVRADGTVQLPKSLLDSELPPGSAVEITPTADGASIRRVERGLPDAAG